MRASVEMYLPWPYLLMKIDLPCAASRLTRAIRWACLDTADIARIAREIAVEIDTGKTPLICLRCSIRLRMIFR